MRAAPFVFVIETNWMENKHTTLGSHCMLARMHLAKISRLNCLRWCWLIQFNLFYFTWMYRIEFLLPAFLLLLLMVVSFSDFICFFLDFCCHCEANSNILQLCKWQCLSHNNCEKSQYALYIVCNLCFFHPSGSDFSISLSLNRQPTQITKTALM